jgi:uncharacterized protein involved in exopolysaccharide biosynthesis
MSKRMTTGSLDNEQGLRAPMDFKQELAYIVFAQLRVMLLTAAAIFVGALLIAFLCPKHYEVAASVLVRAKQAEERPEALGQGVAGREMLLTQEDLHSELELLSAPVVLEAALANVQQRTKGTGEFSDWTPGALRRAVAIELVPLSNVIRMRMISSEPKQAATLLDGILEAYLRYRAQVYTTRGAEEFFSRQIDQYRKDLDALQQQVPVLAGQAGGSLREREAENNVSIQKDLMSSLLNLKTQQAEMRARLETLDRALADGDGQIFVSADSPTIQQMQTHLIQSIAEQKQVEGLYQPGSAKVVAAGQRVASLVAAMREQFHAYQKALSNDLVIAASKAEQLEANLAAMALANEKLQRQSVALRRIVAEIDVLQPSYETLLRKREQAQLAEAVQEAQLRSYVSTLGRAHIPADAMFPRKRIVIPLGLLIGLIAGCSVGFLTEFLERTIKRPADVERALRIPVLLSLPLVKPTSGVSSEKPAAHH